MAGPGCSSTSSFTPNASQPQEEADQEGEADQVAPVPLFPSASAHASLIRVDTLPSTCSPPLALPARASMLLANTQFETGEPLLRPCIIRTYRDLFLNVGYELNAEKILPGVKHGVSLEVLMSLFRKVDPAARAIS